MRARARQLLFIVCVVAAVLLQRSGPPLLFAFAAFTAFVNLFSSHLVCALSGCSLAKDMRTWRDPVHIALLVNRSTSVIGVMLLIYALF